eukprot:scaffold16827_cov129-Skeletonema_marinoi.AAC.1
MKDYMGRAKARQESFNGRLKGTFNILGHRFRHNQRTAEKTLCIEGFMTKFTFVSRKFVLCRRFVFEVHINVL